MPQIQRVPSSTGEYPDFIKRMRVYQLAVQLLDESWSDAETLTQNPVTTLVGAQLYKAVGSIAANIGEGYSRSSGRDRARFFEYALGSARESGIWYRAGERLLDARTLTNRRAVLEEIQRMLLAVIPRERGRTIRPGRRTGAADQSAP
jgi:four helix bundle protein